MWEIIIYNILFWSALFFVGRVLENAFEYAINNQEERGE